jgi:poly-gamma-glutamate synthesis protein (capsule biosynthesis protein)
VAVTVGLLGDLMLGRCVADELRTRPPEDVWAPDLRSLLRESDALIVNLECCVSARGEKTRRIADKPFFFRAPPVAVESLRAIGTSVASLANNHALDYEDAALADTLEHLRAAGIAAAGAGPSEDEARRPVVVDAGGLRLGVVAVTDHPRQYAATSSWGVAWAPLRKGAPRWLLDAVSRVREWCDLVVVFPHWAAARELCAAGADLVAGHSAHVFHGIERIGGATVLYDLGDALDDYARDRVLRNDLGVAALWRPDGDPHLELVALRLEFTRTGLARGEDADWIAARLERACAELGTSVRRIDDQRFALEL